MGVSVFTTQVAITRRRSRTSPPLSPLTENNNHDTASLPRRKNGKLLEAPVNPMTDSGYYSQGVRSRSASGASQTSQTSSGSSSASSCSCDGCSDSERVSQPEIFIRAREEILEDESWIVVDIKKIPWYRPSPREDVSLIRKLYVDFNSLIYRHLFSCKSNRNKFSYPWSLWFMVLTLTVVLFFVSLIDSTLNPSLPKSDINSFNY